MNGERPTPAAGAGNTAAAGLAYFGVVFGAGFLLGPLRILFLEPRIGVRWAELVELPVMVFVMALACRWVLGKWRVAPAARSR